MQYRVDHGGKDGHPLSAWTITLEREALGKLYGIGPDDKDFFAAPKRRRADIKRSRGNTVRDKHFSELNNDEFVKFCKGTGCRRNMIEKLKGWQLFTGQQMDQLIAELSNKGTSSVEEKLNLSMLQDAREYFPNQEFFIFHSTDKGGRSRYAPIIGKNTERIVERMKNTANDEKVWLHVPTNADIHSYRGEYATAIYKMYARPIAQIPFDKINKGTGKQYQSEVYVCRKDEAGKKLDKSAMKKASKALGHNRLEIVANNYLRGI